jgi:uncharacterized protein YegJ (DUF2314 family)
MDDKDFKQRTEYIEGGGWVKMPRKDFVAWKYERGRREHGDWTTMTPLEAMFQLYEEFADVL